MDKRRKTKIKRMYWFLPVAVLALLGCDCDLHALHIDKQEEVTDELEDFGAIYSEFEKRLEQDQARGILRKFKKMLCHHVKKLLKTCCVFKYNCTFDEAAYSAAKFKKKIDKLYYTGPIDKPIAELEKYGMHDFGKKIRYYAAHKHAKPLKKRSALNNNELDKYHEGSLIGGVEIFAGVIISIIPFPATKWLGRIMISDGLSRMVSGCQEQVKGERKN